MKFGCGVVCRKCSLHTSETVSNCSTIISGKPWGRRSACWHPLSGVHDDLLELPINYHSVPLGIECNTPLFDYIRGGVEKIWEPVSKRHGRMGKNNILKISKLGRIEGREMNNRKDAKTVFLYRGRHLNISPSLIPCCVYICLCVLAISHWELP